MKREEGMAGSGQEMQCAHLYLTVQRPKLLKFFLERVHDLSLVPARQQKTAIQARAAAQALCLVKVRNDECGFLLPCPKGCPRKRGICGAANARRATSPAALCALHLPLLRGNGLYEKIVNTFLKPSNPSCRSGLGRECQPKKR
ncbi:hypothetical protein YS110_19180 [Acidovorax sp. YS12]|nr:hypothetical protein YS110_19180 [Acidovorax sp. YS12]